MMVSSPDVADVLSDLLCHAESDILHFVDEAHPYVTGAATSVKKLLMKMLADSRRRERELAEAVESAGGLAGCAPPSAEWQYMAYLSIGHLLPGLTSARAALARRYAQAIEQISDVPTQALLRAHRDELNGEIELLKAAGGR